jgi:hypothetical protein
MPSMLERLLAQGRRLGLGREEAWRPRFLYFVASGHLPGVPNAHQLTRATVQMMPFAFNETPVEYEANRTSVWGRIPLRVPLQLVWCPQQAIVWNGLLTSVNTQVKHLLSAFHEDGVIAYDLQLLQSHEGGLDRLEAEATRVAQGAHPLSGVLRSIAGGYHAHLADLARRARQFDYPQDLHPHFSSLIGFGRYCLTLPEAQETRSPAAPPRPDAGS